MVELVKSPRQRERREIPGCESTTYTESTSHIRLRIPMSNSLIEFLFFTNYIYSNIRIYKYTNAYELSVCTHISINPAGGEEEWLAFKIGIRFSLSLRLLSKYLIFLD